MRRIVMKKNIVTTWVLTSEGRRKSFTSEKELNEYLNKTRPANDENFVVEKVVIEKLIIKSKFPKLIVDKSLMLDVIHHLGEKLKSWKYQYGTIYIDTYVQVRIEENLHKDINSTDLNYIIIKIGEFLANATVDDISDVFLFNLCNYKPCHNYFIVFQNSAMREASKIIKGKYDKKTCEEYCEYCKNNNAIDFGIQFRLDGNSIVFTSKYCADYGRNTSCISTKKVPFSEEEKTKFTAFIDKLLK